MTENEDDQGQRQPQASGAIDQREATELQYHQASARELERRQDSVQPNRTDLPRPSAHISGVRGRKSAVKKFWTNHVFLTVPHEDCRDHFALERTYLGYLRTSLAFANLGVVVSQLFRLETQQSPGQKSILFDLGIPLSAVFIGIATIIALIGGLRFWKQQNAMARKKVYARGWELNVILFFSVGVSLVLLILIIALDTTH